MINSDQTNNDMPHLHGELDPQTGTTSICHLSMIHQIFKSILWGVTGTKRGVLQVLNKQTKKTHKKFCGKELWTYFKVYFYKLNQTKKKCNLNSIK